MYVCSKEVPYTDGFECRPHFPLPVVGDVQSSRMSISCEADLCALDLLSQGQGTSQAWSKSLNVDFVSA
jgi:hypothetical protein